MKILYIITKSNWGGAQRHVFDLAVNAKKSGHDVVVALGGAGMLNDRLMAEGIVTRSIGSMKRDISVMDDTMSFGAISKIVRSVRPDVLHLHSPKAAGLGSFAGRIWRIPQIIYTVHGWAFNENRPLHQKAAIALVSWITMLFSTDIIILSEKEMSQTRLFPLIAQKLRLIPIGINPPVFMSRGSVESFVKSKTSEMPDKRIIVGTISELHKNKGLIYALQAFEKLVKEFPTILFMIIGEGEQRAELELFIKEKGLEKNILLVGYVANAAEYLKAFSIFLLSSVKEGLPYTILEAGFAGLPVIATTVGGIPEVIDDMKCGILIQSKKPDEIFHAVEFLIRHKNVQKEYGRNLQEKVRKEFNLEKMLEATMKVYRERPRPQ